MRLYASCICCLLNKQEQNIRKFNDEALKSEYMKELARIVGNSEEDACAPWLAAEIRKTYQKYFGGTGGYEKEKKEFNQILLDVEKDLEQKILNSEDPLRTALLYARVGNYIDFSALECVDKEELFGLFDRENDILDKGEYGNFCREMQQAKKMVYILDNCGEIVLDKLVIRLLKKQYPQVEITAVVRGEEVMNDATMEDAVMTGLTEETQVIGNGDNVAGTIFSRISPELRQKIEEADLLLAKGQGNFESMYGCGKNVYYLFLCKCDWFIKKFQAERLQGMFVNEKRVKFI